MEFSANLIGKYNGSGTKFIIKRNSSANMKRTKIIPITTRIKNNEISKFLVEISISKKIEIKRNIRVQDIKWPGYRKLDITSFRKIDDALMNFDLDKGMIEKIKVIRNPNPVAMKIGVG